MDLNAAVFSSFGKGTVEGLTLEMKACSTRGEQLMLLHQINLAPGDSDGLSCKRSKQRHW